MSTANASLALVEHKSQAPPKRAKGGQKPGTRRGGRQPGVPNKLTANVKAAIIEAFSQAGGVEYLLGLATTDPRTFCSLLGKTVPTTVTGDPDNPIVLNVTRVELVAPDGHSQG